MVRTPHGCQWVPPALPTVGRGPGTFTVTAQARSSANTLILSLVSPGLNVTVSAGETISPPTAAAGPTAGAVGGSYTYSTGGAVASSGNAVSYLFEWGDGLTSGWLPAGTTSASHTWASAGSYTITVLAADATALLIQSSPSSGVTVSVTTPPSITSLSPTSGAVVTSVTITGSNFGSSQGSSTVTFNGTNAGMASNWSAGSIAVFVPSGATTGPVVVTVGGITSNPVNFTVTPVPSITSVSPTSGVAGAQVTLSGSGFGSAQGTGALWLGTAKAGVVSWSDTQILATVASNATSGNAQVQQGGAWSNSVPFSVNTATILTVVPATGLPGTLVTITGSGFGAAQGAGQVWLGTVNGVVQSWSDTQVVALVAAGSTSGNAQVLQNGVMSNAVPFTVIAPYITSLSMNEAPPGTSISILGSGFGSSQGTGAVWLGSTLAQVTNWTDTGVDATVAAGALSGVARIQQNGVWSNALGFTVELGDPPDAAVKVVPSLLNMAVGDTRTLQALTAAGQSVTGLTWTSSDPTVVSLSPDDPPVLTALAAGHVTITAGTASADVTVWDVTVASGRPAAPRDCDLVQPRRRIRCPIYCASRAQHQRRSRRLRLPDRRHRPSHHQRRHHGVDHASVSYVCGGAGLPGWLGPSRRRARSTSWMGLPGSPILRTPVDSSSPATELPAVHPDGTIFAIQDNNQSSPSSEYVSVTWHRPHHGRAEIQRAAGK